MAEIKETGLLQKYISERKYERYLLYLGEVKK